QKKIDLAEAAIRSLAEISVEAQTDQLHVHSEDRNSNGIQQAFRGLVDILESAGVSKQATTEARALQLALRRTAVILKNALRSRPNWHAGLM
ncbi:hypothetical protein, partial [Escherichia coli]|uniref:hypothetical protein n=1 Tax=Escherichia coli TaxID=562 RepID=UPI000CAE0958